MDSEELSHWQAADAAFDRWLDLPETERDAWLAGEPLSEPVRRRLIQLIAAHLRPSAALDTGRGNLAGSCLGDWTLDSELGRGGMAVVYRAWREDGFARRQAAVKILTLGAMGSAGGERFRREAAILARLNHPNVTALIDSGVADDGTCWLAMPLVDGERIDHWCERHALDAHAIVHLHLQVCDALAYAHRNLVIHRDIKPSNVLVDGEGHVRLLDFGIGQFADVESERTQTLWRALTPGYAAPEQLRGDPPSTAVDIYGLGALLHRLLTGRTPQAGNAGSDTTRPSLLVRAAGDSYHRHYVPLKSDLDRVLLKALSEDPAQRYPTVEALADDLRRWLEGRPVLAQKPTPGYRMRKFLARNKAGVAAAALLAVTVAAGIGATLWQAAEARRQAALAEQQAERARQEAENSHARAKRAEDVRDFLGKMLLNTRGNDGQPASIADLLRTTSESARDESLADSPLIAADVLLLTGTVRYNLEDHAHSLEDLEKALELLIPHRDSSPAELSRAHWELARHSRRNGDYQAMARHAREAEALNDHWDAPAQERFRTRVMLGDALLNIDREAAADHFRTLVTDIAASDLRETYIHLHAINGLLATVTEPEERLPIEEVRLRIARAFYPPSTAGLSFNLGESTYTLRELGMLDRAEALARESIEAADASHQRPMLMRGMARCYLALVLQQRGAHAQSLEAFREADRLMRQQDDSKSAVARCLSAQAYAEAATGHYAEAIEVLARSDELLRASVGPKHVGIFVNCGFRATTQLRQGRQREADLAFGACVPEDEDAMLLPWRQARAERLLAAKDHDAAGAALADLRDKYPPKAHHREWMRPWMLSLLLARRQDDPAGEAALVGKLEKFADTAPLSQCLASLGEAQCMALP